MISTRVGTHADGSPMWIHTIAHRGALGESSWFEREIEFTFLYGKS